MDQNKPRSRDKNVIGGTGSVQKRGSGLGTGPVGSQSGRAGGGRPSGGYGRPSGSGSYGSSGSGRGGMGKIIGILVVIAILFFVVKGMGGGMPQVLESLTDAGEGSTYGTDDFGSGFQNGISQSGVSESGGSYGGAVLNTKVAEGARAKYTQIYGGGKDTVTIMVYLCGTDLESKHGMATADLKEMMGAVISDNINLIVYTGGCKKWANSTVSSDRNQIYQVKTGGITCLEADMGKDSMSKPGTLTKFIQYCAKNYPANRNELILWDHGGGSLTGYCYDEKNASSGSMSLAGIDSALKNAGVSFDFIGFDACLMATLETGLMLSDYADYMIASEETEPGVGWYYTDWLTALSRNTAMPTIEIGKNIVDGFVDTCARKCAGQKTTLSVVDLAELETTVPEKLSGFASATGNLIQNDGYQIVADARYKTREFAQSSKIDQVDLVHLAQNIQSSEADALVSVVKSAVKYNRTSSNMSNANGLSIYFPYKKIGKVDTAVAAYQQIGMDTEYTRCIQKFASVEVSGQAASYQNNPSSGSPVGSILGNVLSGLGGSAGLDLSSFSFLGGQQSQDTQDYVDSHSFDASKLVWSKDSGGNCILKLDSAQWKLVQNLELNVFYDDGAGYIDLGMDNVYELDNAGNLIGNYDGTWLSINRQPVAYYYEDTVEDGNHYSITGYVPVLINGNRAELILVFDDERPDGYIAGARPVYKNGETQTAAKSLEKVSAGDTLEFLCDYYSYSGEYQDSYLLGQPMVLGTDVLIGNIRIDADRTQASYCLTDIYQQRYWTPALP